MDWDGWQAKSAALAKGRHWLVFHWEKGAKRQTKVQECVVAWDGGASSWEGAITGKISSHNSMHALALLVVTLTLPFPTWVQKHPIGFMTEVNEPNRPTGGSGTQHGGCSVGFVALVLCNEPCCRRHMPKA